jgi:hypothetical protein
MTGLIPLATSFSVIWVLLRKLVFRIVSRMAVSTAWLSAGVKLQNRLP